MRAFSCGEPFLEVVAAQWIPGEDSLREMEDDLEEHGPFRVFTEGHLYPRLGKDDARFVLAVAEEYGKLIEVLGTEKICELLGRD